MNSFSNNGQYGFRFGSKFIGNNSYTGPSRGTSFIVTPAQGPRLNDYIKHYYQKESLKTIHSYFSGKIIDNLKIKTFGPRYIYSTIPDICPKLIHKQPFVL